MEKTIDAALKQKEWKCDECQRVFGTKGNWKLHSMVHTKEKPFTCGICDKSFSWSLNLKRHMRVHTGERPYSCSHCGESFKWVGDRNLHIRRKHLKDLVQLEFACDECEKTFGKRYLLRRHKGRVHSIQPVTRDCQFCEKVFLDSQGLLNHIQKSHTEMKSMPGEERAIKTEPEDQDDQSNTDKVVKKFACHQCICVFPKLCNLVTHLSNHSREKGHQCSDCGKKFHKKNHLKMHIKTHNKEDHVVCEICSITLREKNLKHHMFRHTGYPFKCSKCLKGFGSAVLLQKHMAEKHGLRNGSAVTQSVVEQKPEVIIIKQEVEDDYK